MKCRVCQELLAISDKVIRRRIKKGEYVKIRTKYDNVLNVKKRSGHYVFHAKCAKAYQVTERLLLSAGVIKKNPWEELLWPARSKSFMSMMPEGIEGLDNFSKLYEGQFDAARFGTKLFANLPRSSQKTFNPVFNSRELVGTKVGTKADIIIMDDPHIDVVPTLVKESVNKWFDEALDARLALAVANSTPPIFITSRIHTDDNIGTVSNHIESFEPLKLEDIQESARRLKELAREVTVIPSKLSWSLDMSLADMDWNKDFLQEILKGAKDGEN